MKRFFLTFAAFLTVTSFLGAQEQNIVVHEWGTFTTVQGSDGGLLPGIYLEEETLPDFIYYHNGFSPCDLTQKGVYKPAENVTVKMETPVIYFYADQATNISVQVDFIGGTISQWFPQRTAGEVDDTSVIDFAKGYHGWIQWDTEVLAPGSKIAPSYPATAFPTWTAPRSTDANMVRVNKSAEKFLFYRGIGHFKVPLNARFDSEGQLEITNDGQEPISYVFVYDKPKEGEARVYWTGALEAGRKQSVSTSVLGAPGDLAAQFKEFEDALMNAGLYRKEAAAMLDTWHKSYFETPGLRVFWVVPRPMTDGILPMRLDPIPSQLERVLVGRSEVLSPGFEEKLYDDFKNGNLGVWAQDRYFLAYKARIKQMNDAVTSGVVEQTTDAAAIRVWANPGERLYHVSVTPQSETTVTVTLTNLLGERMATRTLASTGGRVYTDLDLGSLPAGLYMVIARSGDRQWTRKIVVE